jgi:hypothetical protein
VSKVIQVLAKMASDSNFQNNEAIEALLASEEINAEQSKAIITKDLISLEKQLDICPDIVCIFIPAEDDNSEETESESEEENNDIKIRVNI